jgi:hypothetical protein
MTQDVLNSPINASVKSIFKTIFATNQITYSDLQTLVNFIRGTQELKSKDIQNIHLIIERLQAGQLKILD